MPSRHPPHVLADNTWYMLTAATVNHAPLLVSEEAKQCVRDVLRRTAEHYSAALRARVILDDHYHLLVKLPRGRDLPGLVGQLHGASARQINALAGNGGRKVWRNDWDTCIRPEADLWTRFNYIHLNPVKHGYVRQPEDWAFSSYRYYLHARGEPWLADCLTRYPVVDCLESDSFGGWAPTTEQVGPPPAGGGRVLRETLTG